MHRFRVTVTERCTYMVDVEARDIEGATHAAIAYMEASDQYRNALVGCDERAIGQIIINPPHWRMEPPFSDVHPMGALP